MPPARAAVLRVHPARPRAEQGAGRGNLSATGRGGRRQLRRREPPVHADCGSLRLGLRQHQSAQLLRRRRQDDGLRDRGAAWVAISGSHRLARGRRHPAAAHLQGPARVEGSGPRRRGAAEDSRRAALGVGAGHRGAGGGPRVPRAGEARHHRQVARHRQPGGRLPGGQGGERDRRQRRDGQRRGDPERD